MTLLSVITSLALALLTGIYVWLTHKLVRQATLANQQTQEAFRQQFQLATYPHLTCTAFRGKDKRGEIVLRNSGSLPAVDVDLLSVAGYFREPIDASRFIQQFVQTASPLKRRLFEGDDGMYSVYDHVVYSEVPQNKQVAILLQVPLPPDFIYVLLQFRDLTGVNYVKVYWFFEEKHPDGGRYRLGSLRPHTLASSARVDFNPDLELITADGSDLSATVDDGFLAAWRSAIPCGHLIDGYRGVEDRGTWSDL